MLGYSFGIGVTSPVVLAASAPDANNSPLRLVLVEVPSVRARPFAAVFGFA